MRFTRTGATTLAAPVPAAAGVTPPGYYLLTVADTANVLSAARGIRVGG